MKLTFAITALAGVVWASTAMPGDGEFHYDEETVRPATYYAAISNLANAVMFSGLGETLIFSLYERDNWLRRAGFVTRPPMPDLALVGPVYASSDPSFADTPDFADPASLRWSKEGADQTLDPGAQAWTLLKITSPQFHLQFHDLRENKIAALMMVPQARAQARVLDRRLSTGGLFAPLDANGSFMPPTAVDQAAVLWASSSLILAATSARKDYWHLAFADLTDPEDTRPIADRAFAALTTLPARSASARAITIEALGRYALITGDRPVQTKALELARAHADALKEDPGTSLEDVSLAIYGLVEAGRLLEDQSYLVAAADYFRGDLMPRWNVAAGVFLKPDGSADYTPVTVGAVVAALNAMRWYGPEGPAGEASRLYPVFFENAIVRSGLLQASPLALVSNKYLEITPSENFAHPVLPNPAQAGIAPVFAAGVAFKGGIWSVTDTTFKTGPAMFLSNMLALKADGRADPFLPSDLLETIH
jgi:hypothetical protein